MTWIRLGWGDTLSDRNRTGFETSDNKFSLDSLSQSPWSTPNEGATSVRKLPSTSQHDSPRIASSDTWRFPFTLSLRNFGCSSIATLVSASSGLWFCVVASSAQRLRRAQRYDSFRIPFFGTWITFFTQSVCNCGCGSLVMILSTLDELLVCGRRHFGCHNCLHSVERNVFIGKIAIERTCSSVLCIILLYLRQHFNIFAQGHFFRRSHPPHLAINLPSVFDGTITSWLQIDKSFIFKTRNISIEHECPSLDIKI